LSREKGVKIEGLHVFDPQNIAVLESEDRKTWQNPENIFEFLELKSDYVAADVGCGSGFFTVPLSRKVKKVYAIDIQKEMLDFLEQKIRRLNIGNIEPLLSRENEVPLENESVDLLLSVNTLHEFHDKEKIISEIQRVLRPHGQAVIVDFKKKETGFGPPVTIRASKEQAKRLFEKKGLIPVKSHEFKYHYLIVCLKDNHI
jgi:ubiquinone/menaquinone biosynthesis C-methylase UbiE